MARHAATPDRLSLLVVAGFVVFTLAADPRPWATVALLVALGALLVAIGEWASRSRVGDAVHTFASPYLAVAILFELSARVARTGAARRDQTLAAADARWFPRLDAAWHAALGRPAWLTDFAGVAYVWFYFFPLVVGLALYVWRSRREVEEFTFATEAAFFVPYVGYLAMPALGPRAAADLHGAAIAQLSHAFVQTVELNAHDAFPSGHTAVALVVAVYGARAFPKWSAALGLAAASIVFSTVYLSYHYVVDVIAGAAVAASMPVLLPALRFACGARNAFAVHAKGAAPAR